MAASGAVLPFRQFVLKIHSRCDLACDHCYVYEHADQSWRGRPTVISPLTVAKAGERIAEHAARHRLPEVRVILHGGEPLLAGPARLGSIARELRRAIEPACRLDLRIHTNGVRLDAELCELFLTERVLVGISLDGDRAANDLHRRYANGRSSYDLVLRAVALLREERYREIYAGLLATIDLRSDPVAVYRALAVLEPPNLDFLLPHGTWDSPPPGAGVAGETRYADWLIAVFGEWTRDGRRVPVRMFESVIETSHGGVSATEALGLAPSDVAVIETDGTIEQADSIKVAYDGAPATGLDIFRHPLDAAAAHPAIKARQLGIAGLSATCRECPVVTSCGGGLYAHRYR
ncbi:MAG: FxsB family cyclophane-forming radical SAM/SPASM peptide maturase, partial [Trebonia sp.]